MNTTLFLLPSAPYELALSSLFVHIFTTYFIGVYATCILSNSTSSQLLRSIPFISENAWVSLDINFLHGTSYDPRLTIAIDLGCHAFLMDQHTALTFLDSFLHSHDYALYRNPNKTLIILFDPNIEDNNGFDSLLEIRQHPALQEIPRTLLLLLSEDRIEIWTHNFKSSPEEAQKLILLDSYHVTDESFMLDADLFPNKMLNMQRRMFRLASFLWGPHFTYAPTNSAQWLAKYKNQTITVDGMGGLVMVEFCKKYNCTWDIKIDQAGEWGTIYNNWTGNGIIGTIAERRADVGVGSLLTWQSVYQFLGFTATIRKVGITCFAPRPHLIPTWQTIALVFHRDVWICVLVSMVSCIVMYRWISHIKSHPYFGQNSVVWYVLNVTAIVLFQAAEILHRSTPETILSIALLIFAINLGNIFVGKNASLRTFPLFETPIDTFQDMAERDMIWTQTHEAWVHSLLLTQNPSLQIVMQNFRIHSVEELEVLADQGHIAFGVSKLNYGHYMIGSFITANNVMLYRLMKEDLYFEYEVSMTTKTCPLRDQLSDLILRIVESGIRAYQEPIVAKRYMDYGVQIKIYHSQDREQTAPYPMSCEDLLSAFIVLGVGVLFAIVIFLGELFYDRYTKRRELCFARSRGEYLH